MMRIPLVAVRRNRCLTTTIVVAALGVTAVHAGPQLPDRSESIDGVVLQRGSWPGQFRADVVVAWNSLAHDIAVAEDQFLTFKGQRALAMMHLAMHDALNAIVPIYEAYAYTGGPRVAHPRCSYGAGCPRRTAGSVS